MNKKIISMIALVLVLSMGMSVCAFAAEGDIGPAPSDLIDKINEILDAGCEAVNSKIGEYAELINEGTNGTTWQVGVYISNGDITGIAVYNDMVEVLIDTLNKRGNGLTQIAPEDAPEAAIPLNGSTVEAGQIVNFVLALGLTDGEGGAFGPNTPIGALNGQHFNAVLSTTDGYSFIWRVSFYA